MSDRASNNLLSSEHTAVFDLRVHTPSGDYSLVQTFRVEQTLGLRWLTLFFDGDLLNPVPILCSQEGLRWVCNTEPASMDIYPPSSSSVIIASHMPCGHTISYHIIDTCRSTLSPSLHPMGNSFEYHTTF